MITVDQNHIWSCSADGTIQAWDTRTLQRVALLTHPGERQPVKCLCKANGSEGIIIWSSSPKDKSICVWRTVRFLCYLHYYYFKIIIFIM